MIHNYFKTFNKPMVILFALIGTYLLVSGGILYVVYLNGLNENSTPIFIRSVVLPTLVAFALFAYELMKPLPTEAKAVPTILLHNDVFEVASWIGAFSTSPLTDDPASGYFNMHVLAFQWRQEALKKGKLPTLDDKPLFYTHLLELTLWQWLSSRGHWQHKPEIFYGISGSGGGGPVGTEEDQTIFSTSDISSLLQENTLLEGGVPIDQIIRWPGVSLPLKTKVSIVQGVGRITYHFVTPESSFTITIRSAGMEAVQDGTYVDRFKPRQVSGTPYAIHFFVNFDFTPKRFKRWSPEVDKQREWFKALYGSFENDFSWAIIRARLRDH